MEEHGISLAVDTSAATPRLEELRAALDRVATQLEVTAAASEALDKAVREGALTDAFASKNKEELAELLKEEKRLKTEYAAEVKRINDAERQHERDRRTFLATGDRLKEQFAELNSGAGILKTALAAIGVASFTMLLKNAVDQAAAFETQMTRAAVEAGKNGDEIAALSGEVFKLSKEFGTLPVEQATALAEVVDAGFNRAADAVKVLSAANNLATTTFTDLKGSTETLIRVMLAYQLGAEKAADTSAKLFVAARDGRSSIQEMGALIGRLGVTAQASGVSLDDLLASVSTVSSTGQPAINAMRGLQSIVNDLTRPSDKMRAGFKELGIEFDSTTLKTKGLSNLLLELFDRTGGTVEGLSKVFKSTSSLQSALVLAAGGAQNFRNVLGDLQNAQEEMNKASERINATFAEQYKKLKAELSVEFIKLGTMVLPSVIEAIKLVTDNIEILKTAFVTLSALMVTRFAQQAIGTMITGLGAYVAAQTAATGAAVTFGTVLGGLAIAGGAITLAVVALGALVTWYLNAESAAQKATKATNEFLNATKQADNIDFTRNALVGTSIQVEKMTDDLAKAKKALTDLGTSGAQGENSLGMLTAARNVETLEANLAAAIRRRDELIKIYQEQSISAALKKEAEDQKKANEEEQARIKTLMGTTSLSDAQIESLRELAAGTTKSNELEAIRNALIDKRKEILASGIIGEGDYAKVLDSVNQKLGINKKLAKEQRDEEKEVKKWYKEMDGIYKPYLQDVDREAMLRELAGSALMEQMTVNAEYGDLIRKYNPVLKENIEYEYERSRLLEAVAKGADGAAEALQKLEEAHQLNIIKLQESANGGDAWAKTMEHVIERIDTAFADMWKGAFDGFKGFADGLKNAFKQLLAEMLHQAITKPIIIRMAVAMGSTGAVQAMGGTPQQIIAAGQNSGSGIGGLASMLGGRVGGALGSFAGSLGANFSGFLTGATRITPGSLGTVFNSGAGGYGAIAGQALAGAGLGSLSGGLANQLLGGRGTNNTALSAVGGTIGSLWGPLGSLVGGAIGSLVSNIFGGAKKEIDRGIELGVEDGQIIGNFYQDMKKAKSFFRGWKRYTTTQALDQELLDTLQSSFDQTKDVLKNIASGLGLATDAVDQFDLATIKFSTKGLSEEEIKKKIEETLQDITAQAITNFVENIQGVSEALRKTVLQFRGNAADMITAFELAAAIEQTRKVDPVQSARDLLKVQANQLTMTYRAQVEELQTLMKEYDGSLESLDLLARAFALQRQAATELAAALIQVGQQIKDMFGQTSENIREALMSEEQLYNYRKSKVDVLVAQLSQTTDPVELQSIAGQINSLIGSLFGGLTDDQKQAQGQGFLDFLDQIQRVVDDQVNSGLNTITNDTNNLNQQISERMLSAVATQQQAADTFAESVDYFAAVVGNLGQALGYAPNTNVEVTP